MHRGGGGVEPGTGVYTRAGLLEREGFPGEHLVVWHYCHCWGAFCLTHILIEDVMEPQGIQVPTKLPRML